MEAASVAALLSSRAGGRWRLEALGDSSFCETWRATSASGRLFVKGIAARRETVLEAEADGLRALAATHTIRVPEVVVLAQGGEGTVLAMEWLELVRPDAGFGERLGAALAALHVAPATGHGTRRFGWHRDNFIGATPQSNRPADHWIEFYVRERLRAMRDRLAARSPATEVCAAVDEVVEALPLFFLDGHVARPSLVHGDLWQGNWGMLPSGEPVIYDPAVARCDQEFELAMMELFGTPPAGFWPAYRAGAMLHEGYAARRPLYQLYHLLNHAVLFGGGYLHQSLQVAQACVASVE